MASIRRAPKGRTGWHVRYRDPQGKQRTKTFELQADAKAWMAKNTVSIGQGEWVDPAGPRVLFGERYKTWLASTVNLRPSTRARDESYAKSLILPTFENMSLGRIDHDALQGWVAKLMAKGYAPATVHRAHQIVGKVLASAVKARLLPRNPCADTELPSIEVDEQRFLTPKEVAALADAIDERYRELVLVAAYGGVRAGEMFALRRGRVDLMRGTVEVAETVVEVSGRHNFGPPKTWAGRRVVPLPRFIVSQLEPAVAGLEPGALVFPAPNGGPIRASLFRRRFWLPAVKAAEVEPLRLHDLRHSAVAFWIAAGASPKEIAVRAGHSSVVTVLDRYGHLLDTGEDKVTDALDAMARDADSAPATVIPIRAQER